MKKKFVTKMITSLLLVSSLTAGLLFSNSISAKACAIEICRLVVNRSDVGLWSDYKNNVSIHRHGNVVNVSSTLNVRAYPSNGNVIGSLNPSERVYVYGSVLTSMGKMYYVQYAILGGSPESCAVSKVGWVSSNYIRLD